MVQKDYLENASAKIEEDYYFMVKEMERENSFIFGMEAATIKIVATIDSKTTVIKTVYENEVDFIVVDQIHLAIDAVAIWIKEIGNS